MQLKPNLETEERRIASLAELRRLVVDNSSNSGLAPAGDIKLLLAATADTGLSQEEVLLQHLRARKFNVAKAFESLSLRAAFLQEHPDLAKDVAGGHNRMCEARSPHPVPSHWRLAQTYTEASCSNRTARSLLEKLCCPAS
jgi:hypothetical protein